MGIERVVPTIRTRVPLLVVRLGLLVALLWVGLSFVFEIDRTLERYRSGHWFYRGSPRWRFGSPPVEELSRFLGKASSVIPPGRRILFSSLTDSNAADFFRYMWAAYFLPRHDLLRPPEDPALDVGEYWIAYHTTIDDPRLELILEDPSGKVYRIRR